MPISRDVWSKKRERMLLPFLKQQFLRDFFITYLIMPISILTILGGNARLLNRLLDRMTLSSLILLFALLVNIFPLHLSNLYKSEFLHWSSPFSVVFPDNWSPLWFSTSLNFYTIICKTQLVKLHWLILSINYTLVYNVDYWSMCLL